MRKKKEAILMQTTRFSEFSKPCSAFVPPTASHRPRQAHLFLVLVLIGSVNPAPVVAQSYLPPMGGPGGGQFKAPCLSGQYLGGLELRAGHTDWLRLRRCTSVSQRVGFAMSRKGSFVRPLSGKIGAQAGMPGRDPKRT